MTNKKKYIPLIIAILMLISGITIIGISHSYYVKNITNEVLSGTIEGTLADFRIETIYVDNTEVQSMNSVPSGYIVDTDNTYCYISDPLVHDTNASISTNSDGEIVISGFAKNEKCVVYFKPMPVSGPTSYWFDETNCSYSSPCSYGTYTGTTYSNWSSVGYNAYIGQDSSKYYTCAIIDGKNVCLSQPYTQYGLEGHTLNNDFTTTQQTSAKNAILQVFNDAGINIDISSCRSNSAYADCVANNLYCKIDTDGKIHCHGNNLEDSYLLFNGSAYCTGNHEPSPPGKPTL